MNVKDAILSRKSVRAFTPQAVSTEDIKALLALAQRAPSGTNTQPWHTYVVRGAIKDAISADVCQLFDDGKTTPYSRYEYSPEQWEPVHQQRRRELGFALYGLLGIEKGQPEKASAQTKRNYQFFDAPVGLFFTIDKYLGRGSWLDTGMYMQSIMLAARDMGLHTCAQAAWINYQGPLFKHLNIPDSQVLVSGMSLGYQDESAIENTLISKRAGIDDVVNFVGFDD